MRYVTNVFILMLLAVTLQQSRAQNFNYTFSQSTVAYTSLVDSSSIKISDVWGAGAYKIPFGFSFDFAGGTFDSLTIRPTGVISFDTLSQYNIVCFFKEFACETDEWNSSLSPMLYRVDTISGQPVLKIEFRNFRLLLQDNSTAFLNFQVWLKGASNVVEIRLGPSSVSPVNESSLFGLINMYNTVDYPLGYLLEGTASSVTAAAIPAGEVIVSMSQFPTPNAVFIFTPVE